MKPWNDDNSIVLVIHTYNSLYFDKFLDESLDLGLQEDQSVEYGIKQCQEMSVLLSRLIVDGKYTLNYSKHSKYTTIADFAMTVDPDGTFRIESSYLQLHRLK